METGRAQRLSARSSEARRYRDILDGFALEYGIATESDMRRARKAAHLSLWLEQEAARTANGESIDIELATRTSNSVTRMLRSLDASKKARERAARRRL